MEQNPAPVQGAARLSSYWLREKRVVAGALLSGTLFNMCLAWSNVLQGRLLDTLVQRRPAAEMLRAAALFLGLVLFLQSMRYIKRRLVRVFANRTMASMRGMVYNRMIHRELTSLSPAQAGDLMTRAVSDVDITVEGMRKATTEVTDTGVLLVSYFVVMLGYDVRLTLAACAFVPVAAVLAEKLKGRIVRYSREARAQSSRIAALTLERAEHALLLRVNGRGEAGLDAYDAELADLERKSVRATVLENSMPPLYNAISMLGIVAILVLGGRNVVAGRWTIGDFSAFEVVFAAVASKASKLAKLFNSIQRAGVSWQRVQPYLGAYQAPASPEPLPAGPALLSVENLAFVQPGSAVPAVSGISFAADAGRVIGVTGPVACGKSSLGLALTGLYAYEGSIRLDGRELSGWSTAARSEAIGFVWHEPMLLSGTIRENVTLGRAGDLDAALRDVCFEQDLAAMPDGVETAVGAGGVRLSGGQQARLALARALYGRPQLLLLDDPFSAVDMATEEAILHNLRAHYPDTILLLISHRLTAFPLTDEILVLRGGTLAERGTHAQLLAQNGLYAQIYRLQTGEAAKGGDTHAAS